MGKYKISMKQAIFIGQAPAFHGQKEPLIGKSSKRLEKLCGFSKKHLDKYLSLLSLIKKMFAAFAVRRVFPAVIFPMFAVRSSSHYSHQKRKMDQT